MQLKSFDRTIPTFTVTDARVLHPSTTTTFSYPQNISYPSTSTVTASSNSSTRYGIVSRLGTPTTGSKGGLLDLSASPPKSSQTYVPLPPKSSSSAVQNHDISTVKQATSQMTLNPSSKPASLFATGLGQKPFGLLSGFYQYLNPGVATSTTQSGLTAIVSDNVFGNKTTGSKGVYGRWQSPW